MNLVSEARKFCKSHVQILSLGFGLLLLMHGYARLSMWCSLICGSFTSLDDRLRRLVRIWASVEILVVELVIICQAESYIFVWSSKLTQSHGIVIGRINRRLSKMRLFTEWFRESILTYDLVPILLHLGIHNVLNWVALRMIISIALSRVHILECSLFEQLFMKNIVVIICSG